MYKTKWVEWWVFPFHEDNEDFEKYDSPDQVVEYYENLDMVRKVGLGCIDLDKVFMVWLWFFQQDSVGYLEKVV